MSKVSKQLEAAAAALRDRVSRLAFGPPVDCVYNPLEYAWPAHVRYLRAWGAGPREVVFLGMNPGPWGMAQCGVPFGEIACVRDWLGICARIGRPEREHPKRPVQGFACRRSEVSGRRLWGYLAQRFGKPEAFFKRHFVANYCPLMFIEASGRNLTPDRLPAAERAPLLRACDEHLQRVTEVLQPVWVIGIGAFAAARAREALAGRDIRIGEMLHPSPANPRANRDWPGTIEGQMRKLGVWP